jgi:ubiquitin-like protein Pup
VAKQEQVEKQAAAPQQQDQTAHAEAPTELSPEAQALKDEMDAILDEIDTVLEENAQEFVANYIQKGGE